MFRLTLSILALVSIAACSSRPAADLTQLDLKVETRTQGDSLFLTIQNPAPIPIRFFISSDEIDVANRLPKRVVLESVSDTVLAFNVSGLDTTDIRRRLSFSMILGSLDTPINPRPLSWPSPQHHSAEIIQGYEGTFSHQSTYSRYALDFRMALGDTVSAADDGWVAGVIDGYDIGGDDPSYRPYANFITLYHPHSGLLTQYVHLEHESSFVTVGDSVARGQALGRVGRTGFTTVDHLHFNVLKPDSSEGIASFPAAFVGDIDGASLKRGDLVSHSELSPREN